MGVEPTTYALRVRLAMADRVRRRSGAVWDDRSDLVRTTAPCGELQPEVQPVGDHLVPSRCTDKRLRVLDEHSETGGLRQSERRSIGGRAGLMPKIERERFAVSLGVVGWLALNLDDRPDSLHIKIGDSLGCVPDVDACHLPVTRIPNDRGDQCVRWIG